MAPKLRSKSDRGSQRAKEKRNGRRPPSPRVWGMGSGVWGARVRVLGLGFWVWGVALRSCGR
jgi:hypothetical protein